MGFFKKLNFLFTFFFILCSVVAIEVNVKNYLHNINSAPHVQLKRYDYPKPQSWIQTSSSFNEETSYATSQHQPDNMADGYHYNKPLIHFHEEAQITSPKRQKNYESVNNGQDYNINAKVQIQPSVYNEHDPIFQPNLPYQNFRTSGLSPNVEGRLSNPTTGDNQGAYINRNIFEPNFVPSNVTIGPTGLFLSDDGLGDAFGEGASISCDVPYQKPSIPDFRAPGRRISEVKCYEYIWELTIRSDMEKRNKRCNKMRSKRSEKGSEFSWAPWCPVGELTVSSQNSLSRQGYPQQGWYNRTNQADSDSINSTTTSLPTFECSFTASGYGFSFGGAVPEEFPHMAALGWTGVDQEYVFKCGGSLISRNFVLTAAHCTASGPDPAITDRIPKIVRIGNINIAYRPDGQIFNQIRSHRQATFPGRLDVGIINIIRHEQYNPNMRYFDIALLQLEYQLEFNKHLQPACLWSNPASSNRIKEAVAAGWGIVDPVTSRTALDLQAGKLDIINTSFCNLLLYPSFGRKLSQVVDHQICAGKLVGGSDVCQGDSGGPLQVKIQLPITDQGSMHTILGIISAGVGCARPNTPGVYTRVSSFLKWIEDYVWN